MVLLFCMADSNPNLTTELGMLLARAAELAASQDLDSAAFMSAAWNAILDAHPGMREELADKELRSQLKKLRKQGLVGTA
jgi:hypothetical protein